jgi:hypothetical protein
VESDLLELLALWERAQASPWGIGIESTYPNSLLQRLYAARRDANAYHSLKLIELPDRVLIVPKEPPT